MKQLRKVAPGSADFYLGQAAYVYYILRDYDRAHEILSKGIALDPSNFRALELRAWVERRQGDFEAYANTRREARQLDPSNSALTSALISALLTTRQYDAIREELADIRQEDLVTGYARAVLRYRDTRDAAAFQASMEEVCRFFESPTCGWIAYILNRDFVAALSAQGPVPAAPRYPNETRLSKQRALTHWLAGQALPAAYVQSWHESIEADRDEDGRYRRTNAYMMTAIMAGMEGRATKAEQLIRQWVNQIPIDWAERARDRSNACRVLAMIGAREAAIDCLRDGLTEPPGIWPELELYLPFYDGISDDPEFAQLRRAYDSDAQFPIAEP